MCGSKPQSNSGKHTFEKKKNNFSAQTSPASELETFLTKRQIVNMSATRENIPINNCKVKMQVDTVADS